MMLRLSWNKEQTVNRVWLFDRPNELDQIKSGMLIFSDGSRLRRVSYRMTLRRVWK